MIRPLLELVALCSSKGMGVRLCDWERFWVDQISVLFLILTSCLDRPGAEWRACKQLMHMYSRSVMIGIYKRAVIPESMKCKHVEKSTEMAFLTPGPLYISGDHIGQEIRLIAVRR